MRNKKVLTLVLKVLKRASCLNSRGSELKSLGAATANALSPSDLIITRFMDSTIYKEPQVDRFISDHASVICHVFASRPSKARCKITYWKLNSVDTDKLWRDVAASVLCNTVRVDSEDLGW